MDTAKTHKYFYQALSVLQNMEDHLCALAAVHERDQKLFDIERELDVLKKTTTGSRRRRARK